jgi:hypothetical protein
MSGRYVAVDAWVVFAFIGCISRYRSVMASFDNAGFALDFRVEELGAYWNAACVKKDFR